MHTMDTLLIVIVVVIIIVVIVVIIGFVFTHFHFRFDLMKANLNNPNLEKMKAADIPDVVSGIAKKL